MTATGFEPRTTEPRTQPVFVYKLSGCGFQSCCSLFNFRYCICFEQGIPWLLARTECSFILCDMIKTQKQVCGCFCWMTIFCETSNKGILLPKSGIISNTFLLLVPGSENSILNWVFKLKHLLDKIQKLQKLFFMHFQWQLLQ